MIVYAKYHEVILEQTLSKIASKLAKILYSPISSIAANSEKISFGL
jgi:hypothetical protein